MTLAEALPAVRTGRTRSIRCPAHRDRSPSLSVSPGRNGGILLKCFAGCPTESVLAAAGLTWADVCAQKPMGPSPTETRSSGARRQLNPEPADERVRAEKRAGWPGFELPNRAEIRQLADFRGVGTAGLELAVSRGVLRVAVYRGHRCWIVTDAARLSAQARRLAGRPFETGAGPKKALTLPGSLGGYPIGLAALADAHRAVLVCEGGPDLLTAHHFVALEGRAVDAAAVGMLGGRCRMAEEGLPKFAGRRVRIFEHDDDTGRAAGLRWADQIRPHSLTVDGVTFDGLKQTDGAPVKDLNDLCRIDADGFEANRWTWEVVP